MNARAAQREHPSEGASGARSGSARIELCGSLVVEFDGRRVEDELPRRQGRLLLGYLVLNRTRPVSRDQLIDAIWGERLPEHHEAGLRSLLSHVRTALGGDLIVGRSELQLQLPAAALVDVEEARRLASAAQDAVGTGKPAWESVHDHAGAALVIVSRGLLPGLEAEWLDAAREELEEQRLAMLELLAESAIALGGVRVGGAKEAARALVSAAPFREAGYDLLIRALEHEGNIAEALRVYDRVRCLLRDDLGTAPSSELQALHVRLLAAGDSGSHESTDPRRGSEPTTQLPLPTLLAHADRARLVARTSELERLLDHWARTKAGERQAVFLAGEPGIGKTRLAAEFALAAHADGAAVLYGRCGQDGLAPYEPFLECLGGLIAHASQSQLEDAAAAGAADLARVLPELRVRLLGVAEPLGGDAAAERYRLFESVCSMLVRSSHQRPLVLVLDDLHWADAASILLLKHLLRWREPAPLLVLGTYRASELRRDHPLSAALADLRRDLELDRVELSGLDASAVGELIEAVAGQGIAADLVATVYAETEGNPFFVHEIVRGVAAQRAATGDADAWTARDVQAIGVPQGAREVIGRQLAQLGDDARRVLSVAAVIGRDFTLDILEGVSDLPGGRALGALEEAVAMRLIIEVPGRSDAYSFAHALIRETLYEDLLASKRIRLHRQVGDVMERLLGPRSELRLADLAHHFTRAARDGDLDRAIEYSARAGNRASELLAYEEAAEHYRNALRGLDLRQPEEEHEHCELLICLGGALFSAGETEMASDAYLRCARIARKLNSPEQLAKAALGLGGRFVWGEAGVVDERRVSLLEEALEGLGERDSPLRALVLARLATELFYALDAADRRAALSEEATAMARRLDDDAVIGEALSAKHFALMRPEHAAARLRTAAEIVALAERTRDRELERQGHYWRLVDLLELGEIVEADVELEVCHQLADQLRLPLYKWETTSFRAIRALMDGRIEEGERLALAARALAENAPQTQNVDQVLYAQIYHVRTEQGRLGELEGPVRQFVEQYPTHGIWRCALAYLYTELGQLEAARVEFDQLAESGFESVAQDNFWLTAIAMLSEVCTELDDSARAVVLYDLLIPFAGRNVMLGYPVSCHGAASRYLALLAATLGRDEEAEGHFSAALAMNEKMGARPWLARTRRDYARFLLARNAEGAQERERAVELIGLAHAAALEMDLPALLAQCERLRDEL